MATVLICSPISDRPPAAASSLPGTCSACGVAVWVSIAGRRTLSDYPGCQTVCAPCGFAVAANDGEAQFQVADGAIEEIEKVLGPGSGRAAQEAVRGLNREMRRAAHRKRR